MTTLTELEAKQLVSIGNRLSDIAADLNLINDLLFTGIENYQSHSFDKYNDILKAIELIDSISGDTQTAGKKELYK